jgi:hypothetical protein
MSGETVVGIAQWVVGIAQWKARRDPEVKINK